jgi:hypothetical protein
MASRLLSVLCVVLAVSFGAADAQEQRVALNPDSTLYVVDASLENRLDLFPDVQGFRRAELYDLGDGTYELVIYTGSEPRLKRERRTLTAEDVDRLRQRVAERLKTANVRVNLNQNGRASFITASTLLGLAEGGLAGAALAPDNGSAVTSLTLIGGASGFFIPLFTTDDARVTSSAAALSAYGGAQGYGHAVQLTYLTVGGELPEQGTAGLAAVLGAAEYTTGFLVGNRADWDEGTGELIAANGAFGNGAGIGIAGMLVGIDEPESDPGQIRLLAGSSLAGSVVGLYVGRRMARSGHITVGDARMYWTSGVVGAQLAGSVLGAADVESSRAASGALTAGGLAGMATGYAIMRNRDFSTADANIALLGTYGGALLGGGIAAAADASIESSSFLLGLGTAAGFAAGVWRSAGEAREAAETSSVRFDIDVEPSRETVYGMDGSPTRLSNDVAPKLSLRVRF